MFEVGQVCLKIAGRDAGKKCAVVEVIDDKYVLIEGETRRRKCNVAHLEPIALKLDISKGASHDAVMKAMGFSPKVRKTKSKTEKPKVVRRKKEKPEVKAATSKKAKK